MVTDAPIRGARLDVRHAEAAQDLIGRVQRLEDEIAYFVVLGRILRKGIVQIIIGLGSLSRAVHPVLQALEDASRRLRAALLARARARGYEPDHHYPPHRS